MPDLKILMVIYLVMCVILVQIQMTKILEFIKLLKGKLFIRIQQMWSVYCV